MFYNCTGLTSITFGSINTSNVTNMSSMFSGCTGLTSLNLSNFNTSKVTNMKEMFKKCSKLITIYVDSEKFDVSAVTESSSMFTSSTKLVGGNGTAFDSSKVDVSMAHVDTTENPGYFSTL